MNLMSFAVPKMLLRRLYTLGSLQNVDDGVQFAIKNRLSDTEVHSVQSIQINGQTIPLNQLFITLSDGTKLLPGDIKKETPVIFPLSSVLTITAQIDHLEHGKHRLDISFTAAGFGKLSFDVEDTIAERQPELRIPRDAADDYSPEIIAERQKFVQEFTGAEFEHIKHYSFDAHVTQGNIEHFTGVAQIPLGFAGPIKIDGEHAQGEFLVPMATSEGTLVASYNRGIKVLNLSGGVRCTVVADAMQRAPVFVFNDARDARDFNNWIQENYDTIRDHAESSSSVAKLQFIEPYLYNKFVYLRFNYTTGDAAGQNMVGRATFVACSWILEHYPPEKIQHFYLESNFATDKKASQVNILKTRGKRVTAEGVVKRDVLVQHMRVEPESLHRHLSIATIGAFLSGANNNGAHTPNAITAMFIATGQDVANVSESSAGVVYTEMLEGGDMYISLTIPSLIVATYGGGTGLPTQRECLALLGCVGKGKVNKLAEIIGAVALAGEVSLGAAISSSDWVSSHERYGRNR